MSLDTSGLIDSRGICFAATAVFVKNLEPSSGFGLPVVPGIEARDSNNMRTITALKAQKRNRNRVNVYLDDEFAFGLALAAAAELRVGQNLSADQISELEWKDAFESGKQTAINFVTYRPRSVEEVRRNLQEKGYHETVVEQVIDRLQGVELLDDEAFSRYWVEQRETFKPRSHFALSQELRQKGVSRNIIETILSEIDEEESARRAGSMYVRRLANLPQDLFRTKLSRFLQRRGFNFGIIKQIADELWETVSVGSEGDGESSTYD